MVVVMKTKMRML